uniref:SWI/SNF-like complex subunit BAF250 C-terminal domain-containing protein n=1 Tax=Opuntia streptacantha TaxID=393608 RepID=A0A7C8YMN8_OPUST
MQKREQGKPGGSAGGTPTPAPKRGRPFGSGTNSAAVAAVAAAADSAAPSTLLGPTLQVHSSFADQNQKRIVLALQSGLKSDLTWALNTLTVLSFKEKDEVRKDATPLAKIPVLLDALLQVIDDWRDIALPRELSRARRVRLLGANAPVTGFGNEYEALASSDGLPQSMAGSATSVADISSQKVAGRQRPTDWWFEEDGLFNLDEEGRAEKQQCAVAASNVLRNFSFMPDNEVIMAQHRHCLETIFQCIEDQNTEDEELVTNALETLVNLGPFLDLRIFSSSKPSFIDITEKRAVQAIMGMLDSQIKAWHCAAAELLGRMIINPDNEPFLLPFVTQIYKRLVDLLGFSAYDSQAAAVGALYHLAEVNMDCRLKLASDRWAVDRLLKIVKNPHPVPEICRKAAMILEGLVSEPQNRLPLLAYENAFAEILFSESKQADTFARILFELTSRPNSKQGMARGVWGM